MVKTVINYQKNELFNNKILLLISNENNEKIKYIISNIKINTLKLLNKFSRNNIICKKIIIWISRIINILKKNKNDFLQFSKELIILSSIFIIFKLLFKLKINEFLNKVPYIDIFEFNDILNCLFLKLNLI